MLSLANHYLGSRAVGSGDLALSFGGLTKKAERGTLEGHSRGGEGEVLKIDIDLVTSGLVPDIWVPRH